jgi:hypothetical protein
MKTSDLIVAATLTAILGVGAFFLINKPNVAQLVSSEPIIEVLRSDAPMEGNTHLFLRKSFPNTETSPTRVMTYYWWMPPIKDTKTLYPLLVVFAWWDRTGLWRGVLRGRTGIQKISGLCYGAHITPRAVMGMAGE